MKLFHQTGHRFNWNKESFNNDNTGDGFIVSPVNIPLKEIEKIPLVARQASFFDPQMYLPGVTKSELTTYPYFPANFINGFKTSDFDSNKEDLAELCVSFQAENDFSSITIPVRHFEHNPSDFFEQWESNYVEPFCNAVRNNGLKKPILLTVLVKPSILTDESDKNDLLNWITKFRDINGVYLIFEKNTSDKQIKDNVFLFQALLFIEALKQNDLEVHIGYTNTEGLIYSLAQPDSISMGSYENLRGFNIKRFQKSDKKGGQGPKARIYSSKLFQWIEYDYLASLKSLFSRYADLFEQTPYFPSMFTPSYKWHFTKPEPYKHYFVVFGNQTKGLPQDVMARVDHISKQLSEARQLFEEIRLSGVDLSFESDGSHIPRWITVVNQFKKHLESN